MSIINNRKLMIEQIKRLRSELLVEDKKTLIRLMKSPSTPANIDLVYLQAPNFNIDPDELAVKIWGGILKGVNGKTIQDKVKGLSGIRVLNLDDNNLKTLPDSIGELKWLKALSLRNNNLTTLPNSIGDLKGLSILILTLNNLKTLPKSIGELKGLKMLYLNDNNLTTSEVERVKKLLPNTKVIY